MLRLLINKSSRHLLTPICFLCAHSKTYIPIRALKDARNILFKINDPYPAPLLKRLFYITPLFAFIL